MVRAFVRYSAAHPELNRLMMQESMSDSWRVGYIVDRHIRPLLDNLGQILPGMAARIWGPPDPPPLLRVYRGRRLRVQRGAGMPAPVRQLTPGGRLCGAPRRFRGGPVIPRLNHLPGRLPAVGDGPKRRRGTSCSAEFDLSPGFDKNGPPRRGAPPMGATSNSGRTYERASMGFVHRLQRYR